VKRLVFGPGKKHYGMLCIRRIVRKTWPGEKLLV
jgi:hypothetical protein